MTDLRGARKQAKLSQERLGKLVGIAQPDISGYESGQNIMSLKRAKRIGGALGVNPQELRAENAAIALKKAYQQGDPARALEACRELVLIAEKSNLTAAQEKRMDALVAAVTNFAESAGTLDYDYEDDDEDEDAEDYGDDPTRDYYGRRITNEQRRSMKRAEESEGWDEEYGADPERDVYGRRIFATKSADPALADLDEDYDDDELDQDTDQDEDYGDTGDRDHLGRSLNN